MPSSSLTVRTTTSAVRAALAPALTLAALVAPGSAQEVALDRQRSSVTGRLAADDPIVETEWLLEKKIFSPARGTSFPLRVDESGEWTISLRSFGFNAYLVVRDENDAVVAEVDGGWISRHARLTVDLDAERSYIVQACSRFSGEGPFELTVERGRPTALAPGERRSRSLADAREGVRAMEEQEGDPSIALGYALHRLANELVDQGRPRQAIPVLERAVDVRREVHGDLHAKTATVIGDLGQRLQDVGRLEESLEAHELALELFTELLGEDDVEVATCWNSLASCQHDLGRYDEARDGYDTAIAILSERLGPNDLELSYPLNNLGLLHQEFGRFDEARECFTRAVEIRERELGDVSAVTANARLNLAVLEDARGYYESSVPIYREVLDVYQETLPANHPRLGFAYNGIAVALDATGRLDEAADGLRRAQEILSSALGEDAIPVGAILGNRASLLFELDRLDEAEASVLRAIEIFESSSGLHSVRLPGLYFRLGTVLLGRGDLDGASDCFLRAVELSSELGVPNDKAALNARMHLALIEQLGGRYEEAEAMYAAVASEATDVLGEYSYQTHHCKQDLVELAFDRGDPELALERSLEAFEVGEARMRRQLWALPEHGRFEVAKEHGADLFYLVTAALQVGTPEAQRTALDRILSWRGRVSRSVQRSRQRVLEDMGPEDRALVAELSTVQARLSESALAPAPDARTSRELLSRRIQIEEQLARRGGPADEVDAAGIDALLAGLPEGAAAIVFARFRPYRTGEAWFRAHRSRPHLAAWVVRAGQRETPLVDLGPSHVLENDAARFLAALVGPMWLSRGVDEAEETAAPIDAVNEALRSRLWDPLAPLVADASIVFVAAEGVLGGLPLETLRLDDGTFLVESHAFVYRQDVTRLDVPIGVRSEAPSLFAIGNVEYGAPSRRTPDARDWASLPGTKDEIAAITTLHEATFGADGRRTTLQGADAKERAVAEGLAGSSVVHVATHGFFRDDEELTVDEAVPEAETSDQETVSPRRVAVLLPGVLSGLVCAGANGADTEDPGDGLLTAEELSWLDLRGVDLVVLSACSTGLGRPGGGEGMLGLRRTLRQAGVGTVISSLWNVDDRATSELMQSFYRRLWSGGAGRLEALRGAQLEMLERSRSSGRDGDPALWGAFVLDGEWRVD